MCLQLLPTGVAILVRNLVLGVGESRATRFGQAMHERVPLNLWGIALEPIMQQFSCFMFEIFEIWVRG
jgi:hypothetical protein